MTDVVKSPEVSKWDIDWLNKRCDRLDKKVKILIALLVEKKLLGEALQKAIEETEVQTGIKLDQKTLEWLMKD